MEIKGIDKKEYFKQYYKQNKEKYNNPEDQIKWRDENIGYHNKWYHENKQAVRKSQSEYRKKRRLNDPLFRLKMDIRAMVGRPFSRITKTQRTQDILGCTFEQLKEYLELQFEPWMNWENKGGIPIEINTRWDVDHIIPISLAQSIEDINRLNHYTNLKPLCAYNNRYIKRDKAE